VATNVLLSALLAGRLVLLGRKYRQAFGKSSDITVYVSVAAITIESALIYTLPQLISTVLLLAAPKNLVNAIPSGIVCVTAAIAPLLITYRVLKGRSLTTQKIRELEQRATASFSGVLTTMPGISFACSSIRDSIDTLERGPEILQTKVGLTEIKAPISNPGS